jgi:uncharacterized protein YqgV (UPF0045/DUF77 family)
MTTRQKGAIMADYVAFVRGTLPNGRPWSTERKITSTQSPSALLTTWQNAWTSAWNLAVTGLNVMYDANTKITQFEVGTLDASMRKVAKTTATVNLVGTDANDPISANNAVVLYWTSAVTQKYGHGFQKLPPPCEDMVNGLTLTATAGANFKAAIGSIKTAIQADGSTFFVAPRYTTESGQPAFAKTVLTTVVVREQLGDERTREQKVPKTYF